MLNFNEKYSEYLKLFNDKLDEYISSYSKSCPKLLGDSMAYAVVDGGKRVRPILCIATAEMLGVPIEQVIYYALAIEFIHSYSLVHDDLPAMDNDDYRRGKLSTHKKFGEAFGILAGDGLLNLAIETCLKKQCINENDAEAMRILFDCSGAKGMIAGQVLDLYNEKNPEISEDKLFAIIENKTSKLILAPVLIASCVSGGKYYNELKEFAFKLGILFQITDDIMDVEGDVATIGKTPHKDEQSDKLTSVKLYGLDGAKEKAFALYNDCKKILKTIPNNEFLDKFTDKMYLRKS